MTLEPERQQELEDQYSRYAPLAEDCQVELSNQISRILDSANINLAVPIQRRVKSLESLLDKAERLGFDGDDIRQMQDFVGLRIILLFQRDVTTVREALTRNFDIVRAYDTQERLEENQFGYSSIHLIVQIPDSWSEVPTLRRFSGFQAEVQIRTLAQHAWAKASHSLQYKQEESVPRNLLRDIYRVSAILETVDLEFERVLSNREQYREELDTTDLTGQLNVDVLEKILDQHWPTKNKDAGEEIYSTLLEDLSEFDIETAEELTEIISRHKGAVLERDAEHAEKHLERIEEGKAAGASLSRLQEGIFYTHVGLTRTALREEFGEDWHEYIIDKSS